MASYYYFGATLPSLRFESPPPLSHEEFMVRARRYLSRGDAELLAEARLHVPDDGSFPVRSLRSALLRRYYRWERALRNDLARMRATRMKKPVDAQLRPGDPEAEAARVAVAAFQAEDPLQGEMIIERERWAFIEGLAVNRIFDTEALCAYSLLLQALERRGRFRVDAGEAGYGTVYRSVLEAADYRDESGASL